jgi:hypothetical protein
VTSWPGGTERTLVSRGAGSARWSRTSDDLFFVRDGRMQSLRCAVDAGRFRPGVEGALFTLSPQIAGEVFDVAPDARRFGFRVYLEGRPREEIRVVLDGFGDLP